MLSFTSPLPEQLTVHDTTLLMREFRESYNVVVLEDDDITLTTPLTYRAASSDEGEALWVVDDYQPQNNLVVYIGPEWLKNSLVLGTICRFGRNPDLTHIVSDRPILINSGFIKYADGQYYRYKADVKRGRQMVWRSDGDYGRFIEMPDGIALRRGTLVKFGDMPAELREQYLRAHALLVGRCANPTVLPPDSSTYPIRYRGKAVPPRLYVKLREMLSEFGGLLRVDIAGLDTVDENVVAELLQDIHDLGYLGAALAERMMNEWNTRVSDCIQFASGCGHFHTGESHPLYGGGSLCDSCVDDDYVWCVDVESYVWHEDAHYVDGDYVYHEPEDDDDDEEEVDSPHVMCYSANVLVYARSDTRITPSPYGEFLLGLELETELTPDERDWETYQDVARDTAEDMDGYAILKKDGSISEYGFEIVTAPRQLKEHIERLKRWKPRSQLQAWDSGSCGMHVHISSQAFTPATLGKFIEFINSPANDEFIRAIAGRHPSKDRQCQTYCERDGIEYVGNPKKVLEGKSPFRYRMVNTQNLSVEECRRLGLCPSHSHRNINTIELRIFRATLKKERLLAQVEFAHAAVMFCRWASFRALTGREFLTWLQGMAGVYPNLAKWFGVKANRKEIEAAPAVRELAEV